jgi:hypothetical protein
VHTHANSRILVVDASTFSTNVSLRQIKTASDQGQGEKVEAGVLHGRYWTLSIAKDVTALAGVPGLQACINSLLVAIDAIKVCYISLRLCVIVTLDDPENDSKRGGCRETG